MEKRPPNIGYRFIQAAIAIVLVVGVVYVIQLRVNPKPATIDILTDDISRLKSANATLSEKVEKLESRLGVLEKELALERELSQ